MTLSRKLRVFLLAGILLCTVGCDQASKHLARAVLSGERSISLPGKIMKLQLAENPGSFLSIGGTMPNSARFVVFTFGVGSCLAALATYLAGRARIGSARFLSLALVLSGGIGNLIDRIMRDGLVTDFAIIRIGPFQTGIFNIADVLIMIGIGLTIWTFRRSNLSEKATSRFQQTGK